LGTVSFWSFSLSIVTCLPASALYYQLFRHSRHAKYRQVTLELGPKGLVRLCPVEIRCVVIIQMWYNGYVILIPLGWPITISPARHPVRRSRPVANGLAKVEAFRRRRMRFTTRSGRGDGIEDWDRAFGGHLDFACNLFFVLYFLLFTAHRLRLTFFKLVYSSPQGDIQIILRYIYSECGFVSMLSMWICC
jgi:hypothetical protein